MGTVFEDFFIKKIRQGLQGSSPLLSDEEELLLTPVSELTTSEKFSPDQANSLQERCAAALTNAYKEDTAHKNKGAAVEWAEYNKNLYNYSQLAISGIVQNWYLSDGRSLEKKVLWVGGYWAVIIVLVVLILGVIYWLFS